MDFKELVRRTASTMKEKDIRKVVNIGQRNLEIRDDEGNVTTLRLKAGNPAILFTIEDIDIILRNCLQVVVSAIQAGDSVAVKGFGRIEPKYREPRRTRNFDTGEWVEVAGRYVPKFTFGKDLRTAARLYELSLTDNKNGFCPELNQADIDDFDDMD